MTIGCARRLLAKLRQADPVLGRVALDPDGPVHHEDNETAVEIHDDGPPRTSGRVTGTDHRGILGMREDDRIATIAFAADHSSSVGARSNTV